MHLEVAASAPYLDASQPNSSHFRLRRPVPRQSLIQTVTTQRSRRLLNSEPLGAQCYHFGSSHVI